MTSILKIMTLNIGNPSLNRAQQQIKWIEQRDEDIFILTETKASKGCSFLKSYFCEPKIPTGSKPKLNVYYPKSVTGDLGVMVLSKYPICETFLCYKKESKYFSRLVDISIDFNCRKIGVIGLYVPSRDVSEEKILRKKKFVFDFIEYLALKRDKNIPYIICGDLNILEKNHVPHFSIFQKWEYDFYDKFHHLGYIDTFRHLHPNKNEYSWVGRTNNGYRYDHCFVSKDLVSNINKCFYIHETRILPITDHSALVLELRW